MRACEFIAEGIDDNANISKRKRFATRGLNLFADGEKWNTDYTLNRIMMAVACTDGVTPPDIDMKSWIGKHKSAHPYTQEEQNMLKLAYKAAGAKWDDLNHGDMDSEEPPGGNVTSPVQGFKGYPR
jgi:hypothetical protein